MEDDDEIAKRIATAEAASAEKIKGLSARLLEEDDDDSRKDDEIANAKTPRFDLDLQAADPLVALDSLDEEEERKKAEEAATSTPPLPPLQEATPIVLTTSPVARATPAATPTATAAKKQAATTSSKKKASQGNTPRAQRAANRASPTANTPSQLRRRDLPTATTSRSAKKAKPLAKCQVGARVKITKEHLYPIVSPHDKIQKAFLKDSPNNFLMYGTITSGNGSDGYGWHIHLCELG